MMLEVMTLDLNKWKELTEWLLALAPGVPVLLYGNGFSDDVRLLDSVFEWPEVWMWEEPLSVSPLTLCVPQHFQLPDLSEDQCYPIPGIPSESMRREMPWRFADDGWEAMVQQAIRCTQPGGLTVFLTSDALGDALPIYPEDGVTEVLMDGYIWTFVLRGVPRPTQNWMPSDEGFTAPLWHLAASEVPRYGIRDWKGVLRPLSAAGQKLKSLYYKLGAVEKSGSLVWRRCGRGVRPVYPQLSVLAATMERLLLKTSGDFTKAAEAFAESMSLDRIAEGRWQDMNLDARVYKQASKLSMRKARMKLTLPVRRNPNVDYYSLGPGDEVVRGDGSRFVVSTVDHDLNGTEPPKVRLRHISGG